MSEQVTRMRKFHFRIEHDVWAERPDDAYLQCWRWIWRAVHKDQMDWIVLEDDVSESEPPAR